MSKKILIVDDQLYIRVLLTQTLDDFVQYGVELLSAENGKEAWAITQQECPDLVLLDVMMPELSGYEVCQRIKSTPHLADTYVMMLTAQGQEMDFARSVEVGADEYVTKPFDPELLIARVAEILNIAR